MAFNLGQDGDDMNEIGEINITPFIDVILVLLIIFMIAAPLATTTVPLDLPVSTAEAQPQQSDPILLSLQGDLKLSLGNRSIERSLIGPELDHAAKGDKQARILLRADKNVPYGELMALMDDMRKSGYLKVGLVTVDGAGRAVQ